jgi:nucleoside-diphosphate-sugar epimerase
MKRILVTGGAGSLGREVVLELARVGHRVRVLDLPQCDFGPLEGTSGVEITRGSIEDERLLAGAVQGVDLALHLAALLPPSSERNREHTLAVNVEGTRALLKALEQQAPSAHLVFVSSVCVYGDTSPEQPPVQASRRPRPLDFYGESKAMAEELVAQAGRPYTILRISGIAVPAFLAPPEVWPFQREQRIEFIARGDVVQTLLAGVETPAPNQILNVAGGSTWQMTGEAYAARWHEALGLGQEEAHFLERPGTFDWYDTTASQALLGYQRTSFERFGALLDEAISLALGES